MKKMLLQMMKIMVMSMMMAVCFSSRVEGTGEVALWGGVSGHTGGSLP